MKITILTLFPDMFAGPFDLSIIKRAKEKGLVEIEFINIRDFGEGKHKIVDDTEYGGGIGMLMRVDVIHKAINHAKEKFSQQWNNETLKQSVILMSASGKTFKQQVAKEYSQLDHLILICGHYEGIDERIKHYIDGEISLGDFVLTGGEIPAMLIADSVIRLIPGVLPEGATEDESFSELNNEVLLEYPHFTKPQSYENHDVPEILLSGNHAEIKKWRHEQAMKKTQAIRPDLLKK
jgi:tRNA (guanine37-N1)-methyltransferase